MEIINDSIAALYLTIVVSIMCFFIIQFFALSSINSLIAGEDLTEFHFNETRFEEPRSFPCPNAADIAPCVCINNSDLGQLTLDCTDISSDEELANIFTKEFPVTDFYQFQMNSSSSLTALNFTCGGVKFLRFFLDPGPFSLVEVSAVFYESCSNADLERVRFKNTQLSSVSFPPPPLSDKIFQYFMSYSNLTSVSAIKSKSLLSLSFGAAQISEIVPGTFDEIPNLMSLYLYDNDITVLKGGSVPITYKGYSYDLSNNEMETIEPGAFALTGEPTMNSLYIYIHDNLLKTIDVSVFGFLMPYIYELRVDDNPLDCGCDLAWIILNPEYMAKVTIVGDPSCADGTLLTDLDPSEYEQYC